MMSYQMAIWREYHRAAKYSKYVMNRDDVDRTSSFFRKLAKEWKSNLLGMFVCESESVSERVSERVSVCLCREKGGGSTYNIYSIYKILA
jgi:hypothetical protein